MVVGRLFSYREGNFSGAMLNFGRVSQVIQEKNPKSSKGMVAPMDGGFFAVKPSGLGLGVSKIGGFRRWERVF